MNKESMNSFIKELHHQGITFKENEPLSVHSTFKIGGNAKVYITPGSESDLASAIHLAKEYGVRLFVAGRGSNIVYPDEGFAGAVISTLSMNDVTVDGCTVNAGAGVSVTELAVIAAKHSLTGFEFAYGIPGSLGGAVFMNAGAYDGEISNVVVCSRYYDASNNTFGETVGEDHSFGYRNSIYRQHPEWTIISAELCLKEGNNTDISAKMTDFITRRKEKQPIEYPSAGSAFKRYPGRYTAQMIQETGLKGFRIGGAQVSEKHAGFIINTGGATAKDVKMLSDAIKTKIFDLHGINIESEIIFVE